MIAEKLIDFIYDSPSTFHVVYNASKILAGAGFRELFENERWSLEKGGKYFTVRNGTSIIAFTVPKGEVSGLRMIASHSDSPAFRIKDNPESVSDNGYIVLNTEKYGGMIMSSWFDRPLSAAGRVVLRKGDCLETRLVNIDRDSLIIPNLAIHMEPQINAGYKYNAAKDTLPLFGTGIDKGGFMGLAASECGVSADDIVSHELYLYNRQRGVIWGNENEFISAPKLDDLQCAFLSLIAITGETSDTNICMSMIFDNEEVGSRSGQGADSDFLQSVTDRIFNCLGIDKEDKYRIFADSFMISADNAHAVHPNHPDKSDITNKPYINRGIVIKNAASMKYVTDSVSEAVIKEICRRLEVACQTYFNRSDTAGGSTLGNISISHISVKSVDMGLPQLAMHSCYETAGTRDMEDMLKVFEKYFVIDILKENEACSIRLG